MQQPVPVDSVKWKQGARYLSVLALEVDQALPWDRTPEAAYALFKKVAFKNPERKYRVKTATDGKQYIVREA